MTMIERVARALAEVDNEIAAKDDDVGIMWHEWVPFARAAIAAMREPTETMRKLCWFHGSLEHWQAMIDAALEEK